MDLRKQSYEREVKIVRNTNKLRKLVMLLAMCLAVLLFVTALASDIPPDESLPRNSEQELPNLESPKDDPSNEEEKTENIILVGGEVVISAPLSDENQCGNLYIDTLNGKFYLNMGIAMVRKPPRSSICSSGSRRTRATPPLK